MPDVPNPAGTPAAPAPAADPAPAAPPAPIARGTATGQPITTSPAAPAGAPGAPAAPAGAGPASPPADAGNGQPGGGNKKLTLTQKDLNDRLARARSVALKQHFGTDDPAEIKKRLDNAATLEKQAEDAKVAAMTEQQKVAHERDKALQERDRYKQQYEAAQEQQNMQEQGAYVEGIAARHVNAGALEEASIAFGRHVQKTDPRVVAKWTERDLDGWFKDYVKKKPFMARAAASPPAAAPATPPPPARRQERNPGGAPRPPPRPSAPASPATNGSRQIRPGQSDSMSRAEAKEEAKKRGYTW